MNTQDLELFCIFNTKLDPKYKVTETPIKINSQFTEKELNQILQKLLSSQKKPSASPFDFLLNGELIRGTVHSYLLKHN